MLFKCNEENKTFVIYVRNIEYPLETESMNTQKTKAVVKLYYRILCMGRNFPIIPH